MFPRWEHGLASWAMSSGAVEQTMIVVDAKKIEEFIRRHADARSPLGAWRFEARQATWQKPSDVKERYAHASIISGQDVVFNLKGGKYRLHVSINYSTQVVVIERIGTHDEYTRWTF